MTDTKGILAGTGKLVDEWLRVPPVGKPPYYRHKSAANALNGVEISTLQTVDFLERAYSQIELNWQAAQARSPRNPSKENWRFTARPNIALHNTSPEVVLERAIVRDVPGDWANQIPTSSGLVGSSTDKVRNIDLALREDRTRYTLFELKVASNTPVFAAVEILLYGLLYLWSRNEAERIGYEQGRIELFGATRLALRTLAPTEFYNGLDFASLEKSIDGSLKEFAETKIREPLELSFAFEELFGYGAELTVESVRHMVENRTSIYTKP